MGAGLLLAGLYLPARAQDPDDLKRGVARISLMTGQVSVQRGDSGDWVAGVINAPLITGDRVATGQNSRAEVQFDSSNMFRMGANADVHLTQLEANRYQMEFGRGIITYRVLRPSDANVEVDTPSISVRPSRVGSYRIAVRESGETEVTARAGEVEVYTPKGSQWVNSGQTLIARGDPADPEFQIVAAVGSDEWDHWNDARDRTLTQSTSTQYVGQGVYGAEDLDNYGSWSNVDGYGYCWRPAVAVDWSPYRYGRWAWLDWYGWTWVPEDPWGWAPYHYGRWFYQANFGWMWYPGLRGARHYWSPALVGFFGFGGGGFGVGLGFGFGHLGWVPLAPYEVFHPWWGRGYYGGFNRNINVTNVNITNVYRNARIGNGVSSVGAEDFRNGRFGGITHPNGEQLRSAGMIHGQIGISPGRSNLGFSEHTTSFTPRISASSRFFTHQQPTPMQRVPFAQQQHTEQGSRPGAAAAASAGRPGGVGNDRPPSAMGASRPGLSGQTAQGGAVNHPNGAGSGAGANGANGGFRRFGDPGGQSANPSSAGATQRGEMQNTRPGQQPQSPQSQSNGYHRFGSPGNSPSAPQNGGQQNSSPQNNTRPQYSAPQNRPSTPSYSAPSHQSAPSYSAPAHNSGGGGGGSSHSSGSSGGHSSSGGRHR